MLETCLVALPANLCLAHVVLWESFPSQSSAIQGGLADPTPRPAVSCGRVSPQKVPLDRYVTGALRFQIPPTVKERPNGPTCPNGRQLQRIVSNPRLWFQPTRVFRIPRCAHKRAQWNVPRGGKLVQNFVNRGPDTKGCLAVDTPKVRLALANKMCLGPGTLGVGAVAPPPTSVVPFFLEGAHEMLARGGLDVRGITITF